MDTRFNSRRSAHASRPESGKPLPGPHNVHRDCLLIGKAGMPQRPQGAWSNSSRAARLCGGENISQLDRSEIPYIHANIELARQRLQSAVAMAMQIDRALTHVAPSSEWVVAQHEPDAI